MQRRNLFIAVGAIALIVIITAIVLRSHKTAVTADAHPAVTVATVRYAVYDEHVAASGRVGSPAGAQIKPAFAIAGVLAGIDVRVGEYVHAGAPLAHLDTSGLALAAQQAGSDAAAAAAGYSGGAVPSAQVRSAQAKAVLAKQKLDALSAAGPGAQSDRIAAQSTYQQAVIKVQSDRAALEREQRLYAAGIAARKDVDAAQAQLNADLADQSAQSSKVAAATTGVGSALAAAKADYAGALSDLRTAQAQQTVLAAQAASASARASLAHRDYVNGTLVAPVDGVVTAIYKHAGEAVDTTTAVVGLGPAAQNAVTLDVPVSDAKRVAIGDPVEVKLTSGGASASGRVVGVSPAVDPSTQSSTVVVSGIPAGALAGDAVEATITVAHDRGLIIPQTAVVQDPQSGDTVVFEAIKKNGDVTFAVRTIHVIHSDGILAQVSGLRPGEQVAAQGAFQLLAPAGGGG